MFSALRERMGDKLRAIGPKDEADKAIAALIEKGTCEELLGPDWQCCFELVDLVNSQPQVMCEKLLRTVNRTIAKPNVKTQLLALTMLDTCVRNCHPLLHSMLATSLLWSDMVKLVQDTSVSRIDDEVRDKILGMIEDYACSLEHQPSFKETYETLVDQGVGFPVRPESECTPFTPYQPPELPPLSKAPSTETQSITGGSPTHHDGAATAAAGGEAATAGGGTEEGFGFAALSSTLKRSGSRAAEAMRGPAAKLASSATLDAAGSAAQRAGGGVAALGTAASTVAKATPVGFVVDVAGNLVPSSTKEGLYSKFTSLFSKDEDKAEQAQLEELEQEALRERQQLERDRQQLEQDRALRGQGGNPRMHTPATELSGEVLNTLSEEDRAAVQSVIAADQQAAAREPNTGRRRDPNPPPHIPDDPAEALQVISNAVGLFAEMVGGVQDEKPRAVLDPVMADLAEQCPYFKSKLICMAESLTDEAQLLSSLALNETLAGAMSRYDELLARALMMRQAARGRQTREVQEQQQQQQQEPQQPQPQQQQLEQQEQQQQRGFAMGSQGFGGLDGDDEPRFTLLDEGEEEPDEGGDLQSNQLGAPTPDFLQLHSEAGSQPPADLLGSGMAAQGEHQSQQQQQQQQPAGGVSDALGSLNIGEQGQPAGSNTDAAS